ncbi:AMIN-like domain-containing (lipo)protein [Phycicoccus avicenniae]|uniref:AMIN-like domain-containing (lipo)protein n=1 Tax=Phycicoccus avicenniae TaxID=2828860 RepID=UPI003D2C6DB4
MKGAPMDEARRTDRTRRTGVVLAAALAVVALAACTTSGKEEPGLGPDPSTTASSPSASPTPTPTASSSTPSPSTSPTLAGFSLADRQSKDWPELGGALGIGLESRVGKHTGYVRVVYEFSGPDVPNYAVRYVDAPVADGSGDRVTVAGDVWLEVLVSSLDVPGESAPSPDDPLPATLKGTGVAEAKAIWGGFEGIGQGFIGLTGERRPFKVTTATNPSRLVVDIAR